MRIVHVTQYFMPWVGYQALYLPQAQIAAGHEAFVISSNLRWPKGYYSVLDDGAQREMPVGLTEEHGIPSVRLEPMRFQPKGGMAFKGLEGWLRRLKPDLVIAYLYTVPTTMQVAWLQPKLGFRLHVSETQLPSQARQQWKHRALRRVIRGVTKRLVLPRAEWIVPLAGGAVEWLADAYDVPRDRMHELSLGIDPTIFHPQPEAGRALRAELGYTDEDYLIGYTGKMTPLKKVEVLIDAVARFRASDDPRAQTAKLLLVGKGEADYIEGLRARAQSLAVPMQVKGALPPAELAGCFSALDVGAWPADCSISHLEAAACGLPIIIPAQTGVDDRVAGGNGLLVKEADPEAMSVAIGELADPAVRARMSQRAVAWTEEHYHWSAIARRWDQLAG